MTACKGVRFSHHKLLDMAIHNVSVVVVPDRYIILTPLCRVTLRCMHGCCVSLSFASCKLDRCALHLSLTYACMQA